MTLTKEDLEAIEALLDVKLEEKLDAKFEEKLDAKFEEKLKPIYDRLDVIELKQDLTTKKLNDLQLDVKVFERDIRRDIHHLNDEMETVIEVLRQHELIP